MPTFRGTIGSEPGDATYATREDMLRQQFPDATEQELKTMARLLTIYRELPKPARDKMQRFMFLMANDSRRAMRLAQRVADGQITIRQMLEAI